MSGLRVGLRCRAGGSGFELVDDLSEADVLVGPHLAAGYLVCLEESERREALILKYGEKVESAPTGKYFPVPVAKVGQVPHLRLLPEVDETEPEITLISSEQLATAELHAQIAALQAQLDGKVPGAAPGPIPEVVQRLDPSRPYVRRCPAGRQWKVPGFYFDPAADELVRWWDCECVPKHRTETRGPCPHPRQIPGPNMRPTCAICGHVFANFRFVSGSGPSATIREHLEETPVLKRQIVG